MQKKTEIVKNFHVIFEITKSNVKRNEILTRGITAIKILFLGTNSYQCAKVDGS